MSPSPGPLYRLSSDVRALLRRPKGDPRNLRLRRTFGLHFLDYILAKSPFKVKLLRTDNDSVFTNAYTGEPRTHPLKQPRLNPFTLACKERGIIHRLNPPKADLPRTKW